MHESIVTIHYCSACQLVIKNDTYLKWFKWLSAHLSQEVVLAHHVPVPDLHRHASTLIILTFIQTQLQHLIPVREACLLYDLMKQPGIITLTAEHAHEEFILILHTDQELCWTLFCFHFNSDISYIVSDLFSNTNKKNKKR